MTAPLASLRGVSRTFGAGDGAVHAIRGVDLDLEPAQLTTISGSSGSGKSTLLNIIGLLDRPSEGSYELHGRDLAQSSDAERSRLRARTLGFVFQAFHLIGRRSVLDNTMLGGLYAGVPRSERQDRALQCLDAVGLPHRVLAKADTLSGGERQRVAIARALVARPPLLLCDEPTGNLDSANSAGIIDVLAGLVADGHSVVIVTHEPDVAALGDQRITIVDGWVRR